MAARYNGLEFKTALEARWAAYFDLVGWSWWVNPVEVQGWKPDFKVSIPCDHSECDGSHTLLVAVLPVLSVDDFGQHPCTTLRYEVLDDRGEWLADAGAAFGMKPWISQWEMSHGAGGGLFDAAEFGVDEPGVLWEKAGTLVY